LREGEYHFRSFDVKLRGGGGQDDRGVYLKEPLLFKERSYLPN
jgi:hypothetical protein